MKCCLCGEEIEKENGWKYGNNAEPTVINGRCCNYCNDTIVIPERLKIIKERQVKGGITK